MIKRFIYIFLISACVLLSAITVSAVDIDYSDILSNKFITSSDIVENDSPLTVTSLIKKCGITKNLLSLLADDYVNASYAVALAENNPSLKYDVYPVIHKDTVYFCMPCTADLTNLTITCFSENDKQLSSFKNINFKSHPSISIILKGKKYNLTAVQSELPSLIFNIDEDYGTIEAMNTCPTHDTTCYGDVILEVTDALAEKKGWQGFESVENNDGKNGTVEIKGRGNTTWTWDDPLSKKPYQFKLEKKTDILNMGKHKTWILLKNDQYLIKNKLGLDLAKDLDLPHTSSSEFVDVFMNGEYLGLYLLCEKVEVGENRVDISDLDEEFENNGNSIDSLDMTGGYLLEFDCWPDTPQIYHEKTNYTITVKSPENLAETATDDNEYSYISDLVTSWLDAVYSDGNMPDGSSYLDYINIESFLNYYFHQEFLTNYDCGISSTYIHKDKDSIDPLFYAGPIWDNDRTFELTVHSDGWIIPNINLLGSETPTLYNQLSKREDFAALLVEHYENSDVSQIISDAYKKIDVYFDDIGKSAWMNVVRWDLVIYDTQWLKDFFKDYMIARAAWIDENYHTLLENAK